MTGQPPLVASVIILGCSTPGIIRQSASVRAHADDRALLWQVALGSTQTDHLRTYTPMSMFGRLAAR